MSVLLDNNQISFRSKQDILACFLATLGNSPLDEVLRVVATKGDIGLFERCVEAADLSESWESFVARNVKELLSSDAGYAPLLVFKRQPLAWSSLAMIADSLNIGVPDGEVLDYARHVLAFGLFEERSCYYSHGTFHLSARFISPHYLDFTHEVHVDISADDGSAFEPECLTCRSWQNYQDDYYTEDYGEFCNHAATVVLAFLLDPKSFEGCPNQLEPANANQASKFVASRPGGCPSLELRQKVRRGIEQYCRGEVAQHDLIDGE